MSKPRLWITRKLSANTEARAQRDYDVVLNPADSLSTADDIVRMSKEVDAIIPCHSEHFDQATVARLDARLKIVANHSVGVDHCDLDALKQQGICVTNTPDVLSDATAEIAMLLLLGAARRAAPELECGASYHASLESLLPNADFLSLHCPATEQTKGLINADTLAMLPDGAVLVNTARGALVEEAALVAAIESGKISAAGLDCFAT